MATGVSNDPGGVMATSDVAFAGADAWSRMTGMNPMSPAVGGPGYGGGQLPYDVDGARSRIVSNDAPAAAAPVAGPGVHLLDDWRDVANFRGSPVPWLLLLILVMIGFMQFRVQARAGRAKASAALG